MAQRPTKRIGLVGAGWVTQHHLDAYRRLAERARVVAVADPKEEARSLRAKEFGIPATYASAEDMLAREDLDAIDIAAPREHHVSVALLGAEYGLPILCQKPLAPSLAEARDLVARIGQRVPLMVHENWRFRPHYRRLKRWLEEGRTGRPLQALMCIFTSGLIPDAQGRLPAVARQPFFRHEKRLLVAEVLIHHIDVLRFLLGPLRLCASRLGKVCREVAGEDNATLYLATDEDASAMLVGNFAAHGWPPWQCDHFELIGEAGTVRLSGGTLECFGRTSQRIEVDLDADYKASYVGAISHFLDCLDSGARFETEAADNLKTLEIVEQAYAAAHDSGGRHGEG